MRTRKFSQVALLLGLALGMGALWSSATPLVTLGDAGVGGWEQMFIDGVWVAVYPDQGSCVYCWGTTSSSCSEYVGAEPCRGGSISVAVCSASSSAGGTTHAGEGPTPCWSWIEPYCNDVFDAACY